MKAFAKRQPVRAITVIAAGLLVTTALTSASAADEQAERPVALTGNVLDVDSIEDGHIIVTVSPRDELTQELEIGDEISELQLPNDIATTSGSSFEIRLDPTSLPAAYINDDGRVDLWIEIVLPTGPLMASTAKTVLLFRDTTGQAHWVDPIDMPTDGESAGFEPVLATVDDLQTYAAPPAVVEALASPTPAEAVRGMNGCGSITTRVAARKNYSTAVGMSYPIGSETSWFEYGRSHRSEYGVAAHVSGVWRSSGTVAVTNGTSFTWSESGAKRTYRIAMHYKRVVREYASCGVISNRWTPDYWTGAVGERAIPTAPTWSTCAHINSTGVWKRSASGHTSYTHSTGVKAAGHIGIDLSYKSDYGTDRIVFYRFIHTNKDLCGSGGDDPTQAGRIRMRTH